MSPAPALDPTADTGLIWSAEHAAYLDPLTGELVNQWPIMTDEDARMATYRILANDSAIRALKASRARVSKEIAARERRAKLYNEWYLDGLKRFAMPLIPKGKKSATIHYCMVGSKKSRIRLVTEDETDLAHFALEHNPDAITGIAITSEQPLPKSLLNAVAMCDMLDSVELMATLPDAIVRGYATLPNAPVRLEGGEDEWFVHPIREMGIEEEPDA